MSSTPDASIRVLTRAALATASLLATGLCLVAPVHADEGDELIAKTLTAARALAEKSLPAPSDLGEGWKRPWEIPVVVGSSDGGSDSTRKAPTEAAWWDSFMRRTFPVGLPEAHYQKITDMLAGSGREGMLGMIQQACRSSRTSAQRFVDEAGVMTRMAAGSGGDPSRLDEGTATIQMLLAKYARIAEGDLKTAFLSAATRVDEYARMEYLKSNDWDSILAGKSDRDLAKLGAWVGVVTVTLSIVKSGHEGEILDLAKAEASTLEKQIAAGYEGLQRVTGPSAIAKLADRLRSLEESRDSLKRPPPAGAAADDIARRAKELESVVLEITAIEAQKEAAGRPITVKVLPREIGDNAYVVRVNAPAFSAIGRASVYSAWLRNGRALVEISFAGNFPEDQMNKEMDHFLQEMDSLTALYRE